MNKKVLIIAGDFSESYEIIAPYQVLKAVGMTVHVVCPKKKSGEFITTAFSQKEEGYQTYTDQVCYKFSLNYDFDAVNPADYDGLVLPGGARAPEYLRMNKSVREYTQHFTDTKKPILAVCHGVQILCGVKGSINGATLSGFYAQSFEVENAGATYKFIKLEEAITYNNFTSSPAHYGLHNCFPTFIKHIKEGVTFDNVVHLHQSKL